MITEIRHVEAPKNWVVFNGKDLREFLVYTSGDQTFSAPQHMYDTITIPGRNGDFKRDLGRYSNIEVQYSAWIASDFRNNMQALRSYLLSAEGYCRLEDTYDPDHYRLGTFEGPLDVKGYYGSTFGSFTLKFNCKPERWRKDGDNLYTLYNNAVFYNDTDFIPRPLLIIIPNSSSISIIVGNKEGNFQITGTGLTSGSTYYIDTDLMQCYKGSISKTNYANSSFDFTDRQRWFKLIPGENTIGYSGVKSLQIKPRWYDL